MHWPQIVALSLFALQLVLVAVCDRLFDRHPQLPWYIGITAFWVWLLRAGGFFGGYG